MANELIDKFLAYCKDLKDDEEPKKLSEILGREEARLFAKQLANGEYPNLTEVRDGKISPKLKVLAISLGKELEGAQTDGGRTYNPFANNAFMHRGITLRSMQRNLQELDHLTALKDIDLQIANRSFTGDDSADAEIKKAINIEIANIESRYGKYNPVRYYRNFRLNRKKKKLENIIENDSKRLTKQQNLQNELLTNFDLEKDVATHGLFSKKGIKARSQLLWRKIRGKSTDRLQDKFTETMLLNDIKDGKVSEDLNKRIEDSSASRDSLSTSKDQKEYYQKMIDSLTAFQSKIKKHGEKLNKDLKTENLEIDTKYKPQMEELKVKIERNREYINDQNLELRLKTDFGKAYKEICKGLPGRVVTDLDALFNARTQKQFTDDKEFIKLCEEQLGEAEAQKLIQKLKGYLGEKPQNNPTVGGNGNNDNEQDKDPNAPIQELEGFDRLKFYNDFFEKIKDRYNLPEGVDKDNIGDQKHFEFQSKTNGSTLELDTSNSGKVRFTAKDKDGNNVSPELADFAALVQSYKDQGYDKINLSANSSDEYNQKLMAALKLAGMEYDIIGKDGKPIDRESAEFKKIDEGSQKLVDHEKNKDKPEVILEEQYAPNESQQERKEPLSEEQRKVLEAEGIEISAQADWNSLSGQQKAMLHEAGLSPSMIEAKDMIEKVKGLSPKEFETLAQGEAFKKLSANQQFYLKSINEISNNDTYAKEGEKGEQKKEQDIKDFTKGYLDEVQAKGGTDYGAKQQGQSQELITTTMLSQIKGLSPKEFSELVQSEAFQALDGKQQSRLKSINAIENNPKITPENKTKMLGSVIGEYIRHEKDQRAQNKGTKQKQINRDLSQNVAAIKSKQGNSH